METVYKRLEGGLLTLAYVILAVYLGLLITVIILQFAHFGTTSAFKLPLIVNTITCILLLITFYSQYKLRVNEEHRTLSLTEPVFGIGGSTLNIDDITAIEVIRSPRTRRIRRLLLRCGPIKYFRVYTARPEDLLAHLTRLNGRIEIFQKTGSIL